MGRPRPGKNPQFTGTPTVFLDGTTSAYLQPALDIPPDSGAQFAGDPPRVLIGISLRVPVELVRTSPASGMRYSGFTMHVRHGTEGDRTYRVIVQVLDRSQATPTSTRQVDEICDGIASRIDSFRVDRRSPVVVSGLPGRQFDYELKGRHCIARVTFTGRHAYYWDVNSARPLDPTDPLVAAFLDSATIYD